MRYSISSVLVTSGLLFQAAFVLGHGDESHDAIHKRNEYISRRSLAACRDNQDAKALFERSLQRRTDMVNQIRRKRGLVERSLADSHRLAKRDFDSSAAINHNSTFANVTYNVDSSVLFGGNSSCLLTPEVTEGPYFVSGEYVRSDITDDQAGVELYLDIQVIDTNTCKPVSSAYFDAWHTNATGVYSGIVSNGNGAGNRDPSNINTTFCRGVQFTDSDGVIKFKTIFPGHYSGRTTHIHIMSQQGGTIYPNGTYSGHGYVTHVGQLFFDEGLRRAVEALPPYNMNTQMNILNKQDSIAIQQADNDYDPFMKYAYLGDSVADGLLAWITVGVDPDSERNPYVAVELRKEGGVPVGNYGVVGTGEEGDAVPSGEPEAPPPPENNKSPGVNSTDSEVSKRTTAAETSGNTMAGPPSPTPSFGVQVIPSLALMILSIVGCSVWML
ncbi:hypothetical protein TWF696_000384 [Orbilia brochopaga]|uniref:Intradiol ring-cleavage dioxygenases domain-containing protein n=1 Tax=Orbilia brochopaga TaxID=3140254 RepID=A0AAV9VB44_9PEZI